MAYHALLCNPSFFLFLLKIDHDIADYFHKQPCPHCGKMLDRADFFRKAGFGIPEDADKECRRRFSFCCRHCRKRLTPPSARYLPKKCYLTVVIVIMSAMKHGIDDDRLRTIQKALGVSRQTVDSWKRWWEVDFASSSFWRGLRGRMPGVTALPDEFISYFNKVCCGTGIIMAGICVLLSPFHSLDPNQIYSLTRGYFSGLGNTQTWCPDARS
jgi:hypothetical protein